MAADVVSISNAAADAAGIPRLLLLAAGEAESGLDPFARRPSNPAADERYWPDVSGGVWQQTVRWDPDYHGGSDFPGSAEIERVLQLQYDVERSARIAAANLKAKYRPNEPDAVFRALCRYNWPAGDGQPANSAVAANYRNGIAEAQSILGASPMPKVTYDRDEPAIAQNDAWSCAPTSTRWALTAVGRHPAEGWMEAQMISDGVVSIAQGLLDASGRQLAAWITKEYGEFGYYANNESRGISFDALAAEFMAPANPYPGLIGGSTWNHWSGLRSYDPQRGVLLLANPAEGWHGVGQTMSRQQFAALGPFSLVRVLHDDLMAATPVPPPADPMAAIRAQYAVVAAELEKLGTLIGA